MNNRYVSRELTDYWLNPLLMVGGMAFSSKLISSVIPPLKNVLDLGITNLGQTIITLAASSYVGNLIGKHVELIKDTRDMDWEEFLRWEANQTLIMGLIDAGVMVTLPDI